MLDPQVQKNFQGYSYEPKGMGQLILPLPIEKKKGVPQSAKVPSRHRQAKSVNITSSDLGKVGLSMKPLPNPNGKNLEEEQASDLSMNSSVQNNSLIASSSGVSNAVSGTTSAT